MNFNLLAEGFKHINAHFAISDFFVLRKSAILAAYELPKVKKIAALFLLLIFMFNLFGYRIFLAQMLKIADRKLEAKFDNNAYDNSQLMELKVPLSLPYTNSHTDYVRCDGEIDINGVPYKYVKRKIVNDTLYLMCIANTQAIHIENIKNDFFKMVNDLGPNKNSKKGTETKSISKSQQSDYDQYTFSITIASRSSCCHDLWFTAKSKNLITSVYTAKGQPPDLFI